MKKNSLSSSVNSNTDSKTAINLQYAWTLKKPPTSRRNLIEHLVNQAVYVWEQHHAQK